MTQKIRAIHDNNNQYSYVVGRNPAPGNDMWAESVISSIDDVSVIAEISEFDIYVSNGSDPEK